MQLTHINSQGKAQMVDVSRKPVTERIAMASCKILLKPETLKLIRANKIAKGEVLNTARIAGICAAKRTFELIPLTHPLPLDQVDMEIIPGRAQLKLICRVKTSARTGAEMEALVGAAIASLTVYDMVKAVDRAAEITSLRLEFKSGGKSGTWKRKK